MFLNTFSIFGVRVVRRNAQVKLYIVFIYVYAYLFFLHVDRMQTKFCHSEFSRACPKALVCMNHASGSARCVVAHAGLVTFNRCGLFSASLHFHYRERERERVSEIPKNAKQV